MGRQHLSKQLKEFIREQIHSVVMLEVLLLLHRNQPRAFRAVETATELGIEEEVAKEQLYTLVAIGLITQSEGDEPLYWYHPWDPGLSTLVNELALAYSKQRIPVLSLILTKRPDRIRLFAEAFRLVKGND